MRIMKTTILKCVFVVFVVGLLPVTASFFYCCESFKDELERKSRASEVVCSQNNDSYVPLQSFGDDCCNSSKAELKEKWDAYSILCPSTINKPSTDRKPKKECPKSMKFKKGIEDYAISTVSKGPSVMKAVTVCFWLNTKEQAEKGIHAHYISYAVPKSNNHFLVVGQENLKLLVVPNDGKDYSDSRGIVSSSHDIKVNDGRWHHICVIWQSQNGQYLFYKDGKEVGSGSLSRTVGKSLAGKGTWVLAQDQDTVGGDFQEEQSAEGEMTGVNIWDRVISREEISKMYLRKCQSGGATGNVKTWADFMSGIRGNVEIGKPTCCQHQ